MHGMGPDKDKGGERHACMMWPLRLGEWVCILMTSPGIEFRD